MTELYTISGNKKKTSTAESNAPKERLESVEIENIKITDIIEETKEKIDLINKKIYQGEINIFESANEMGHLTVAVLEKVTAKFASALNTKTEQLPFALFVFGATARNQMLPNSDLDIALFFEKDCPENIKKALRKTISELPFNDEIDFAQWNSFDEIKKENCPSLMEYNKIVESIFVSGNTKIGAEHKKIITKDDTKKDKEQRLITEYGLLHLSDYRGRETEYGPNLKYDFGGSRDIVFLDWYYLLNNIDKEQQIDKSSSLAGLDLMEEKEIITPAEKEEVKSSIELILLTKFALWSKNISEEDEKLLYLSDYSLESVYEDIEKLLLNKGIKDSKEYVKAYHKAKSRLHIAIKKASLEVLENNQDLKEIWKIAKEKKQLDDQVLEILQEPSWEKMVPFAVRSTSPEILYYLVKKLSNLKGYEYILRIISQNGNINDNIKQDLTESRLDPRFKKKLAA